jgi:hypothetical protein
VVVAAAVISTDAIPPYGGEALLAVCAISVIFGNTI